MRSPRPGGAGLLAKLAEVRFIEVLRLYMNEHSEGRTGWLAGAGDRIVGAALNALHKRSANLLRGCNAQLASIAQDVGYQTDTAFSRAFRCEFGAPPAAWRRSQATREPVD